jgi:hypothetical protein
MRPRQLEVRVPEVSPHNSDLIFEEREDNFPVEAGRQHAVSRWPGGQGVVAVFF